MKKFMGNDMAPPIGEMCEIKPPLFSVIIPTFNRAGSIAAAIRSVLSQTCEDFEVVVVDDGSTDDTAAIISSFRDHRIHYFFQTNSGASKARNSGIDASRGKFAAFLDSDDFFLPDHLANALPVLMADEKVCTYNKVVVDRGDGVRFLKPPRPLKENEHISDYLMRDRGFVPTISLIVPRYLAVAVRYDDQLGDGDDVDFAIRLVSCGGVLHMLPEPGAVWNDQNNPGRLSSKFNYEQRIAWLNRIRPLITWRAYWGDMGWAVAKGYARKGMLLKSFWLYLNALLRGCYRPKMAVVVFLQILLPLGIYRRFADRIARVGIKP